MYAKCSSPYLPPVIPLSPGAAIGPLLTGVISEHTNGGKVCGHTALAICAIQKSVLSISCFCNVPLSSLCP